ncbi:MAG: DnaJ domain-containing protein [Caulobacteraceae bacterium]
MLWLAIGFILVGIVLGASGMKRAGRTLSGVAKSAWRPGTSMMALAALVGAVVAAMRSAWLPALLLTGVFVSLSLGSRIRPAAKPGPPPAPRSGMSLKDAASILGVPPDASADEVQNAYVRLMRVVHPDHGGATGLAVQLNAARDLMLERLRGQ